MIFQISSTDQQGDRLLILLSILFSDPTNSKNSFPHKENLISDLATERFKRQPDFDRNSNFGHFLRTYRDPGFFKMAEEWTPRGSIIPESGPRIPEAGPRFPYDENLIANLATAKFKRQPDFDHNTNFGHFLRTYRDPGFLRMTKGFWRE